MLKMQMTHQCTFGRWTSGYRSTNKVSWIWAENGVMFRFCCGSCHPYKVGPYQLSVGWNNSTYKRLYPQLSSFKSVYIGVITPSGTSIGAPPRRESPCRKMLADHFFHLQIQGPALPPQLVQHLPPPPGLPIKGNPQPGRKPGQIYSTTEWAGQFESLKTRVVWMLFGWLKYCRTKNQRPWIVSPYMWLNQDVMGCRIELFVFAPKSTEVSQMFCRNDATFLIRSYEKSGCFKECWRYLIP